MLMIDMKNILLKDFLEKLLKYFGEMIAMAIIYISKLNKKYIIIKLSQNYLIILNNTNTYKDGLLLCSFKIYYKIIKIDKQMKAE